MNHEQYMSLALELAAKGMGAVAPNPMVGCVIVHNNTVIGQGFHTAYGQPHAEVEAIRSVENKDLLRESTLYVTLEPCAHFGKTPPCADLIVEYNIPRVVIGTRDSFSLVNGKGIEKLQANGIIVVEGILENECRAINKRFFTFHEKKRPYVILKWAQTADGYMDKIREEGERGSYPISSLESRTLTHQWRSWEHAILVGPTTALNDDPSLTVRLVEGRNPIRVVIDERGALPLELNLFNNEAKTLALIGNGVTPRYACELGLLDESGPSGWMKALYNANIQSVLVEGGHGVLQSLIDANQWDEMRIFASPNLIASGLKAPLPQGTLVKQESVGNDQLYFYTNE